jgi:hypothetical protein
MEKHSPTDDAPRSDEQQEHERDAERLMLQQEAEHLAHAKYRADSEAGLDGRRVAVPDLAILETCRVIGRPAPSPSNPKSCYLAKAGTRKAVPRDRSPAPQVSEAGVCP